MTFEEFFAKKKIDLTQLATAEPALFAEFKSHFALMGEKSFDHTKKFWFNKLRRLYYLATPEKAVTQFETKIASQAEPLSSPTMKQTLPVVETTEQISAAAPKPAFKPRNIPVKPKAEEPAASKDDELQKAPAPAKTPGFKPRNVKPAAATDSNTVESRPGQTEVSDTPATNPTEAEQPKPGYKPKFNIRNIPKNPAGAEEQTGHGTEQKKVVESAKADTPSAEKPAYKPRFNIKNIPVPKPETQETVNLADKEEGAEPQQADEPVTPAAYKPKFKMKNFPQAKPESSEEPAPAESLPAPENAEEAKSGSQAEESVLSKPVYKPRFNIKNIKPKTDE